MNNDEQPQRTTGDAPDADRRTGAHEEDEMTQLDRLLRAQRRALSATESYLAQYFPEWCEPCSAQEGA